MILADTTIPLTTVNVIKELLTNAELWGYLTGALEVWYTEFTNPWYWIALITLFGALGVGLHYLVFRGVHRFYWPNIVVLSITAMSSLLMAFCCAFLIIVGDLKAPINEYFKRVNETLSSAQVREEKYEINASLSGVAFKKGVDAVSKKLGVDIASFTEKNGDGSTFFPDKLGDNKQLALDIYNQVYIEEIYSIFSKKHPFLTTYFSPDFKKLVQQCKSDAEKFFKSRSDIDQPYVVFDQALPIVFQGCTQILQENLDIFFSYIRNICLLGCIPFLLTLAFVFILSKRKINALSL